MTTKFTCFKDMHSGGGTKIAPYETIYIEAPEGEAKVIFYNRFGRNPEHVTCTCCGGDYSIREHDDLAQATGYDRGCDYDGDLYIESPHPLYSWPEYVPLEDHLKREDVLVIRADDIKPEERTGTVPEQGYVWRG
jgi:hypothetical protein